MSCAGIFNDTKIQTYSCSFDKTPKLDRVWISSGSSLIASFGFGFEYFGFQNSKIFPLRVFRVHENWLKTRQVFEFTGLREDFDQNLAKMHLFLAKFSIVQKLI